MDEPRFYKSTFTLTVLSEDPIPSDADIAGIVEEATTGEFSMDVASPQTVEVTGPEMAQLLIGQGSDPGFFQLAPDGSPLED